MRRRRRPIRPGLWALAAGVAALLGACEASVLDRTRTAPAYTSSDAAVFLPAPDVDAGEALDAGADTGFVSRYLDPSFANGQPVSGRLAVDAVGRPYLLSGRAVVRLDVGGAAVDPTYGDGGVAELPLLGGSHDVGAFSFDEAGRLLVAFHWAPCWTTCLGTVYVARLTPDGAADPTFGHAGLAVPELREDAGVLLLSPHALVVDPTGIYVAGGQGHRGLFHDRDGWVVRFTTAGLPDTGFGPGGVREELGSLYGGFRGLALVDGGVLALGSTWSRPHRVGLHRFAGDGGDAGVTELALGAAPDSFPSQIIRLPDGRLVVAGVSAPAQESDPLFDPANPGSYEPQYGTVALVAIDPAGVVDPSFGDGGHVDTPLRAQDEGPRAFARNDGKIVVSGYVDLDARPLSSEHQPGGDVAVVRVDPSGAIDGTYGAAGIVRLGDARDTVGTDFALDPARGGLLVSVVHFPPGLTRLYKLAP